MLIVEHTGDVFSLAASLPVPAVAHGVNCVGAMGAGVAKTVRGHWPELYKTYRAACRTGVLTPGGMLAWQTPFGGWVYNLATQDRPGPHARLEWVTESAKAMVQHAAAHSVSDVAAVRIGCGIGGLTWPEVRGVLSAVPGAVTLHVVTPRA